MWETLFCAFVVVLVVIIGLKVRQDQENERLLRDIPYVQVTDKRILSLTEYDESLSWVGQANPDNYVYTLAIEAEVDERSCRATVPVSHEQFQEAEVGELFVNPLFVGPLVKPAF